MTKTMAVNKSTNTNDSESTPSQHWRPEKGTRPAPMSAPVQGRGKCPARRALPVLPRVCPLPTNALIVPLIVATLVLHLILFGLALGVPVQDEQPSSRVVALPSATNHRHRHHHRNSQSLTPIDDQAEAAAPFSFRPTDGSSAYEPLRAIGAKRSSLIRSRRNHQQQQQQQQPQQQRQVKLPAGGSQATSSSSTSKQQHLVEQMFRNKLMDLTQKYMTNRAIGDRAYYVLLTVYALLITFGTISNSLICLTVSVTSRSSVRSHHH